MECDPTSGIDSVNDLELTLSVNYMLLQVWFSRAPFSDNAEGNGGQFNYSSGDYGSGCIGRSGLLLQAFAYKGVFCAKIDPISEELKRGPNGLCIRVRSLLDAS